MEDRCSADFDGEIQDLLDGSPEQAPGPEHVEKQRELQRLCRSALNLASQLQVASGEYYYLCQLMLDPGMPPSVAEQLVPLMTASARTYVDVWPRLLVVATEGNEVCKWLAEHFSAQSNTRQEEKQL